MDEKFYWTAAKGDVEEVKEILRNNPDVNVNWKYEGFKTIPTTLGQACEKSSDFVIPLLLAHPDIDVNLKEKEGWTPFMTVCYHGCTSVVRLLLKDSRVKANEPDDAGHSTEKCRFQRTPERN